MPSRKSHLYIVLQDPASAELLGACASSMQAVYMLSQGAVVCRLYIEQYSVDTSTHKQDAQEALAKIIKVALDVSQLSKFTGREKPTVIT